MDCPFLSPLSPSAEELTLPTTGVRWMFFTSTKEAHEAVNVGAENNYQNYFGGFPYYTYSIIGPPNPTLIIKAPYVIQPPDNPIIKKSFTSLTKNSAHGKP